MSYSGRDLVAFVRKERPATFATSTARVLRAAYGDGWPDVDLRLIDVTKALDAFDKSDHGLKPASVDTYKSRFRKSLELFRKTKRLPSDGPPPDAVPNADRILTYPLVLRREPELVVAHLALPIDLTHEEAARIGVYVTGLVL